MDASVLDPFHASQYNALQLAYVGDSVYSLLTRQTLLEGNLPVQAMHARAAAFVSARVQALTLACVEPFLTEAEKDIVRRGRNAQPFHTPPRGATRDEYCHATALEALFGYLFITGQRERMKQLFTLCAKENLYARKNP